MKSSGIHLKVLKYDTFYVSENYWFKITSVYPRDQWVKVDNKECEICWQDCGSAWYTVGCCLA